MKKVVIVAVVAIVLSAAVYFYLYHGHRDIVNENAVYTETVSSLKNEFKTNAEKANLKYLNKTIIVAGGVSLSDKKTNSMLLDNAVYATFAVANFVNLQPGTLVKLKGRFLGYDDLLEQFKMGQTCIVQ